MKRAAFAPCLRSIRTHGVQHAGWLAAVLLVACEPSAPSAMRRSCDDSQCVDDGAEVSCCDSRRISGGTFAMGRCGSSDADCQDAYDGVKDELPQHEASVSAFELDTFEVTVGRFRRFVDAYETGWRPCPDAGAHLQVEDSGWSVKWDPELPSDARALVQSLECNPKYQTYSADTGTNDQLPINCVSWYVAFAFCTWDGGRLPTEAEWEYAAAGGSENRLYPWGSESADELRAGHHCVGDGSELGECDQGDVVPVGSMPKGRGRYGQHDLAGNMWEWVLDRYDAHWYEGEGEECTDCANMKRGAERVLRGGDWYVGPFRLRATDRHHHDPAVHADGHGIRCARSVD